VDDVGEVAPADRRSGLVKICYPACSAVLATTLGALASLATTAAYRVAVWCVVAGAASLAAGLMQHSARVNSLLGAFCRWLAGVSS
jgi:hypothetical protein